MSAALIVMPIFSNAAQVSLADLSWTATGAMGTISGKTAMPASPLGNSVFSYVTTSDGVFGVSPLNLKPDSKLGGQTNGSKAISSTFNMNAGDSLEMYFNYISTDGRDYVDYSWARLLDANNNHVAWLFASESSNSGNGNVVPGSVLKSQVNKEFSDKIDATVNNGNTVGFEVNSTDWQPLGESSGQCWDSANTCGSTGWLKSQYTIANSGIYSIELGVMNWGDQAFQSALAFDFNGLNKQNFINAIDGNSTVIPEPESAVLLAIGLIGLVINRRVLS